MSFVDVIRPISRSKGLAYDALCILFASLLLGLLSQVKLPLWFTPVPLTIQSLGVMLIAAALGSKRGSLALIAYLSEGALGLPVFAGGACGLGIFAGHTAGYLIGFVIAAYGMGFLLERGWKKNLFKTLAVFSAGSVVILGCGVLWLAQLVSFQHAMMIGFTPFIVGSLLQAVSATLFVFSGWKALRSFI